MNLVGFAAFVTELLQGKAEGVHSYAYGNWSKTFVPRCSRKWRRLC